MKTTNLIILWLLLCIHNLADAQQNSFYSNLPLVSIQTDGVQIPDSPKIKARMKIFRDENGGENSLQDEKLHFDGNISIEIRGSSSQMFPKKSYSFELKDSLFEDMDFPLLGMPEEEDWVLYAPYSDKALIRNALAYNLAASLGEYAPRYRLVELFVNNNYQGIYLLLEKLKRDKNRIDIAKLKPEDIEGVELTGGYVVKIDKTTGDSGADGWYSSYFNANERRTYYQYHYPKSDAITEEQKKYIQNFINNFETELYKQNFNEADGCFSYINEGSFIQYLIVNELSKNIDGYRLSTYLHKDKNEKLCLGPVWDFNLAFGNARYHKGWSTEGMQCMANLGNDSWQNPFWWDKLMKSILFKNELKCHWSFYRKKQLSEERIFEVTDSLVNVLQEAYGRNFEKWPILDTWVWPNYYVGNTYEAEVGWMKNWISSRLNWLDSAMPGNCDAVNIQTMDKIERVKFYPNPFETTLLLQIETRCSKEIEVMFYNSSGLLISYFNFNCESGFNQFSMNTGNFPKGIFIYRVIQNNQIVRTGKLTKLR